MGGLSHTVSGDIASFRTPSRVPIESLKFHFLPKQAAGTPSPENPIPIEGWTGLNGKRCHKNIIKPYYSVVTVKNGLTITPTTNGIRISGTAESRTPCFICTTDNIKLGVGDKVAFSLYVNGDISECENPFLGYYKSIGVWGSVIYSFSSSSNWNHTIWTVPDTYTDISYIDSYIYIPQGVTVDFEIGLQGIISPYYSDDYEPYSEEQIPITFPSNGKNRYYYDEDNIEEGLTTTTGYTRPVYHTGVFGDGRKVSISGSIIEAGVVSNTSLNVGYLKDGIITVIDTFISYVNGSITSRSFVVPNGYEFVIIATNESSWSVKRNLPRYNIQIEYADSPTTYEPYSSDSTFYGGYIDPVAGEIVAEYYLARAKKSNFGNKSTPSGTGRDYRQTQSIFPKTASGVEWATARQQQKFNRGIIANPWSEASYGENIGVIATQDSMNPPITYMRISEEVYQAMNDDDYAEISYKLREPIHIPIPAEDLKAFLDHNNFWSDANDITEVTYAVTESKDMLATRKKAMDFDHAHHKKVMWNQISLDGNFQDTDYRNWSWNAGYGAFQIHDGVATWTANQTPSAYYYTGFTRKVNYLLIPYNHKILVSAKMRTSAYYSTLQFRIYGMVNSTGGAHTYFYSDNVQAADTWQTVRGFISDRPETPPSGFDDVIIKKFKPLLCKSNHGSYEGIVDDGTTMDVKELMAFDLTQMFGLGNEPQTVAEFERICEINGIDLTTYQPYDTGSDRWLIIP